MELKDESDIEVESSIDDSGKDYNKNKEDIMTDFDNMIKGDKEPYVLIKVIDENIKEVREREATEMIVKLEEIQKDYVERYTEELFTEGYQMELLSLSEINQSKEEKEDSQYLFFDEKILDGIKNGDLKELVQELKDGKYKLINQEGVFYPIIDYERLKDYDEYISEEIIEYIHIKAKDSSIPTVLDAEIKISFEELSEKLIKVEKYIDRYPLSEKQDELLNLYESYLHLYLVGTDNTLIYEEETEKIKDDVWNSYQKTIDKKDTKTAQIVAEYKDIIKENKNKIDSRILFKGEILKKQAISELK